MNEISPIIVMALTCCIGPAVLFGFGFAVGRHGAPVKIQLNEEWRDSAVAKTRARRKSRGSRRAEFAVEDDG